MILGICLHRVVWESRGTLARKPLAKLLGEFIKNLKHGEASIRAPPRRDPYLSKTPQLLTAVAYTLRCSPIVASFFGSPLLPSF